jgi:hypothetical protein
MRTLQISRFLIFAAFSVSAFANDPAELPADLSLTTAPRLQNLKCGPPVGSRLVVPRSVLHDPSFSSETVTLRGHVLRTGEITEVTITKRSAFPALNEISLYKVQHWICEPITDVPESGTNFVVELKYARPL